MKKKLLIAGASLALTLGVATPSFASSDTPKETEPFNYSTFKETYYSSIPEEVKNYEVDTEIGNGEYYLTDEEVTTVTFESLIAINEKIKDDNILELYSEEKANEIVAKLIKESINDTEGTKSRSYDYEIPGWDNLNSAEKDLAKKHPIEFTSYALTAVAAGNLAEAYYGESQLYQGNGDAFRHSYWNAILVQELGNDPLHGTQRARTWTTAHEATSSGNDKEMDLFNNEVGIYHAYLNFNDTRSQLSDALRKQVSQGGLVRIVGGELAATSGVTGK